MTSEEKLPRVIGLKELIALTINSIIGAGIFALPATAAKMIGAASPLAFLTAGFFTLFIVLCFAELGSRFERTGGAYLYAHEAFQPSIAFLIGWMYFLARLTSAAALTNAMVGFIGYFLEVGAVEEKGIALSIILLLVAVNYLGVKLSSRVINFLTIAKLLPIAVFIFAGFFFMDWKTFADIPAPSIQRFSQTLLVVIFAFTGFEVIGIPGAEIVRPQKNLPRGILIGTVSTILIYMSIQLVAVGFHPNLADSKSPIAESAEFFLGSTGGKFIALGAICSTLGTLTSLFLVGPRILYAMALQTQLPHFFSQVHRRFLTPHFAILSYGALCIALSLSGTFTTLVTLSVMARLVTYIGSATAVLVLRRKHPSLDTFRIPGGPFVPLTAILFSLFLLSAASGVHFIAGGVALILGAILYIFTSRSRLEKLSADSPHS